MECEKCKAWKMADKDHDFMGRMCLDCYLVRYKTVPNNPVYDEDLNEI